MPVEDLNDIDDDLGEVVMERLALRARARHQARDKRAAATAAAAVREPWREGSDTDDDDEDEDGGEDEPFSLPPGWWTVPGATGRTFTWTNGERVVGTITQAWESYNGGVGPNDGAPGARTLCPPPCIRAHNGPDALSQPARPPSQAGRLAPPVERTWPTTSSPSRRCSTRCRCVWSCVVALDCQ